MSKNNPLSLSWGLFHIPFYKAPIRWLKELRIYCHRRKFLLKHGYPEQLLWETYFVSQATFKEVFTWYLNERSGDIPNKGVPIDDLPAINDQLYTKLLALLDKMDEESSQEIREASKDEFFDLLKEYWFHFWD